MLERSLRRWTCGTCLKAEQLFLKAFEKRKKKKLSEVITYCLKAGNESRDIQYIYDPNWASAVSKRL